MLIRFQLFNLNQCVVINMHWKVLCFCKSHRSLIYCVLMYSIYSGLFFWANLAMCQLYVCALTKKVQVWWPVDLLERETSHHGALHNFLLRDSQTAHITLYMSAERPKSGICILWKPSVSWILLSTLYKIEFASFFFFFFGFEFYFFSMKHFSLPCGLNFLNCIFLREGLLL